MLKAHLHETQNYMDRHTQMAFYGQNVNAGDSQLLKTAVETMQANEGTSSLNLSTNYRLNNSGTTTYIWT